MNRGFHQSIKLTCKQSTGRATNEGFTELAANHVYKFPCPTIAIKKNLNCKQTVPSQHGEKRGQDQDFRFQSLTLTE